MPARSAAPNARPAARVVACVPGGGAQSQALGRRDETGSGGAARRAQARPRMPAVGPRPARHGENAPRRRSRGNVLAGDLLTRRSVQARRFAPATRAMPTQVSTDRMATRRCFARRRSRKTRPKYGKSTSLGSGPRAPPAVDVAERRRSGRFAAVVGVVIFVDAQGARRWGEASGRAHLFCAAVAQGAGVHTGPRSLASSSRSIQPKPPLRGAL